MNHILKKRNRTLMSGKYYSMLLGGTLTMMVVSVMLMSDSVIAGAVIGADAAAGITLVTPIYSMAAFLGSVFSLGVPILYSSEMGKFNKKEADRVFAFGLLMSVLVGIALFLIAFFLGDIYLRSSHPTAAVLEQARNYLFWMRFTILLLPLQMLIAGAVYNDGDETVSTIANGVQGAGNLVTSIVLSHIMGIRGIGLASFLFNVVALLILCAHFFKESNSLKIGFCFSIEILKHVVRFSIIDASSYLFLAVLTAILNAFTSSRYGAEYLILVSVVALSRELQMVFDGIGEAITPLLGIYLGEECSSGVRNIYRLARRTAVAEGIAVTVILLVFAPAVPVVLHISNPVIVHMAVTGIRIVALGSTFVCLLYLLTSYYLVREKIALGLFVSILRDLLLSAPMAVLLGTAFGAPGMFAGLAAGPAAAWALSLAWVARRYGKENCPLILGPIEGKVQSFVYDLTAEPEEIIALQQEVAAMLAENHYDHRTTGRVKLLIEELYMLIREKNEGKRVLSECAVLLRPEGVQIITKDDGILFDISEDDVNVTSLTALTVSAYMEKLQKNRRHLTTLSFNRSSFLIRTQNR